VARLAADPDLVWAELAIVVRSDLKGYGIGLVLMQLLIEYARGRGIGTLVGDVLSENTAMLALARHLGFTAGRPDAGVVRVTLPLAPPAPSPA
jgi:acetyltransferase